MREDIPNTLYHYTNQEGIFGILSKKEFWASNAYFLNDTEEVVHAYSLFEDLLKELSRDQGAQIFDKTISYLKRELDRARNDTEIFACCFSTKPDDLNQWRSYSGGGNGYMIGIDSKALQLALRKHENWTIVKCVYSEREKRLELTRLLNDFESFFDGVFPFFGPGEINEGFAERVALKFSNHFARNIAPTFKHAAFEEEQEWRLVYHSSRERSRSGGKVHFRSGKSSITPYLQFRFGDWFLSIILQRDDLDEIGEAPFQRKSQIEIISTLMIRPHINEKFVIEGFRSFVESLNIPRDIVTKSRIPYRAY